MYVFGNFFGSFLSLFVLKLDLMGLVMFDDDCLIEVVFGKGGFFDEVGKGVGRFDLWGFILFFGLLLGGGGLLMGLLIFFDVFFNKYFFFNNEDEEVWFVVDMYGCD